MTWGARGVWAAGLAAFAAMFGGAAFAADDRPEIEATRIAVDSQQVGAGFAECGRGERALGGGMVPSDPTDGALWGSGPLTAKGASAATRDGDRPKRWYGAAGAGNTDQVYRLFAICAPGSSATIEATQFTAPYRVPTGEFAECGPGERAVGGGIVSIGPPDFLITLSSGPLDASGSVSNTRDGDIPKQWHAAVYNADDDGRIFKVFAICVPHSKATIEATDFTVKEGETGEGRAKCGRGERALGGGVAPIGSQAGFYMPASGPVDASGSAANTKDGDAPKQWFAAMGNGFAG